MPDPEEQRAARERTVAEARCVLWAPEYQDIQRTPFVRGEDWHRLFVVIGEAARAGLRLEVRTWISEMRAGRRDDGPWLERWPNPDARHRRVEVVERHADGRLEILWASPPPP